MTLEDNLDIMKQNKLLLLVQVDQIRGKDLSLVSGTLGS